MTDVGPTKQNERLILLDALRGFALAGVLLVNLRDLTLHSLLSDSARATLASAGMDRVLEPLMTALVDVKAFTIFTLLFGIGFAMQAERAAASGEGMQRYVRRLLVLLVIGALHAYLFWWGDILRLYALLGLFLVPLAKARPRTLAILGVIVAVFTTPVLRPFMTAALPALVSSDEAAAAALTAFQSSNVPEMLRGNLKYDWWTHISAWGLPFYVLGRLLIGVAIGKSGLLRDAERRQRIWMKLLAILLPLGIACTAFVMLRDNGFFGPVQGWWRTESARGLVRIARSAASVSLGLSYIAIFVLLFQRPAARRWMQLLAPIGRMALTNYLLQTVIAIGLFYGVGLGIGPRFGLPGLILAAAVIFLAQLAFSRWWLARFRFGPAEWLWRSLTYGRLLPMRAPEVDIARARG